MEGTYTVIGVESSPYSVKVRAAFRYRRLPHVWLCRMPQVHPPLTDVRPLLMPVVRYPDGSRHVDSTPILLDLEARHPGVRSLIPDDPVLAFCARLIEDMADEWLSKAMFHYRFSFEADRAFAPGWVMDDAWPDLDAAAWRDKAAAFLDRQSARMPLVGIDPDNAPVLAAALVRVLAILEPFVALDRFLFGGRPSLADFGLFGQLKTLASDPTPAALIRRTAPRVEFWVRRADDTSGVEGDWQAESEPNASVQALLAMAGDTYLPFLAANAAALAAGDDMVSIDTPDGAYRQPPFGYQAKCLAALRRAFADLEPPACRRAEPILDAAGCLAALVD